MVGTDVTVVCSVEASSMLSQGLGGVSAAESGAIMGSVAMGGFVV